MNELAFQQLNKFIYPICDSEISYQSENYLDSLLEMLGKQKGYKVISISTKCNWSDEKLLKLQTFNKIHAGEKIIKLSISFSRKNELDKFEPNAISYSDRISLLKKLKNYSIPTVVLIKPILPFVAYEEYKSLIDDCINICKDFVLGPLYVDKQSKFYNKFIYQKYQVEEKYCEWLKSIALCVKSPNYEKIKSYIINSGGTCYDSDAEFLETL